MFVTFKSCLNGLPSRISYMQNKTLIVVVVEIFQCHLHVYAFVFTNTRTFIYNGTNYALNAVILCCVSTSINCCILCKYQNQNQERAQSRKPVHSVQRVAYKYSPCSSLYICVRECY